MATIYDIANLCRTSIATVSYVLNGRGDEHRISKACLLYTSSAIGLEGVMG